MNQHIERAKELRSDEFTPNNCGQTIFMTYAKELGLSTEQASAIGCNFGGGMKYGGTCGVITSGLAVLGGLGIQDPKSVQAFRSQIKENHNGMTDCAELLRANVLAGGQKKPHCDGMILEAIELIDRLSKEKQEKGEA